MQYKKPSHQPWGSEVTFLRAQGEPLYLLLGNSMRVAKVLITSGYCHRLLAQRRHPPLNRILSTRSKLGFVAQQMFGVVKALGFKEFITLEF